MEIFHAHSRLTNLQEPLQNLPTLAGSFIRASLRIKHKWLKKFTAPPPQLRLGFKVPTPITLPSFLGIEPHCGVTLWLLAIGHMKKHTTEDCRDLRNDRPGNRNKKQTFRRSQRSGRWRTCVVESASRRLVIVLIWCWWHQYIFLKKSHRVADLSFMHFASCMAVFNDRSVKEQSFWSSSTGTHISSTITKFSYPAARTSSPTSAPSWPQDCGRTGNAGLTRPSEALSF